MPHSLWGSFPKTFKKAVLRCVYIPKGNKPVVHVQNHRSISLLEVASKVYEKIIN